MRLSVSCWFAGISTCVLKPESSHFPWRFITNCHSAQIITNVDSKYRFILTLGSIWPHARVSDWAIFYFYFFTLLLCKAIEVANKTSWNSSSSWFKVWFVVFPPTPSAINQTICPCPLSLEFRSGCIVFSDTSTTYYLPVRYNRPTFPTSFRTHSNYPLQTDILLVTAFECF